LAVLAASAQVLLPAGFVACSPTWLYKVVFSTAVSRGIVFGAKHLGFLTARGERGHAQDDEGHVFHDFFTPSTFAGAWPACFEP
jgi:hypothetical protein